MDKIVVATSNLGKLDELRTLLAWPNVTMVPQREFGVSDAVEDAKSYVENALLKARHAAHCSGHAAIADDSGLMVAALNGAPGIYSARYCGRHGDDNANNAALLAALQSVPSDRRQAAFVCAAVYVRHATDPLPAIAVGKWHGRVLEAPRGARGFGYDPLFFVPTHGCTAAELDAAVKNTISHRARAMRALKSQLNDEYPIN
jgi:XTP/dITP diphosphohydrolase